jgi:hypothetical protein
MKICWVCDKCNWLQVSDSKEHHQMDSCRCGESAVDLEDYMCRMQGCPRVIARLEDGKKWNYVRGKKRRNKK